jgi:DNA ligase-1
MSAKLNPWQVLKTLAATDSRLEKERVIAEQMQANNSALFAGFRLAYDAMITFGVKQVPSRSGPDGSGLSHAAFVKLADQLQARELTGHDARDAIQAAMQSATNAEWNDWYRLILIKDLKCGTSDSTINKVAVKLKHDEFAIPLFECQLAKDCTDDDGNVDESLLKGRKQVDVKLDGMRVLTIVRPNGQVDQFSRNGKELLNFTVIKDQIAKTAKYFKVPTVLDGEVMSASFQDLMKQARRKSDVQADDSVLNLFDIVPLDEFLSGEGKLKQSQRNTALQTWYDANADKLDNVTVVGHEIVDLGTADGQKKLMEINARALAGKYEGIMLKDVDAVYECKRSYNWLKMKPFIEESLRVVAVEEGKPDSKFVGTMGALVCEDVVDGKPVRVNVGSGYSIQQRAQIWADYTGKPVVWQKKVERKWVQVTEQPSGESVVGQIAEVRADALTKSQEGEYWSMRFPRFKTFRGFKRGEKL